MHAPEVECIAKGNAHKRYEFDCKASFVTTSKTNWIVRAQAFHGNPYGGHTLLRVAEQRCGLDPRRTVASVHAIDGSRIEVTEQGRLFDDCMYFFYLTNEPKRALKTHEVVYGSNARCDQENILAQLNQTNAVRCMHR